MDERPRTRALPCALLLASLCASCGAAQEAPEIVRVKNNLRLLESALDSYRADHGGYPPTAEGLSALVRRGDPLRPEGYLKELPRDAWDAEYRYVAQRDSSSAYQLYSTGPNRIDEHGGGDDLVLPAEN